MTKASTVPKTSGNMPPGMEAYQLPKPSLPEIPDPITLNTSEEIPRFLKIRQFLTERALNGVETSYLDEVRHDTVIRATAMGARLQHGFYKGLPKGTVKEQPDHIRPITVGEKVNAIWRRRQDRTRRHREHVGHEAVSLYERKPSHETFLPKNYNSLSVDEQRWATLQAKLKAVGAPASNSVHQKIESAEGVRDEYGRIVVPPIDMPRGVKGLHKRNESIHTRKQHEVDYYQSSLDRGANGDTSAGRHRRRKIARAERKMIKLQRRADNYDRLSYLRDVRGAEAKVTISEQKADDALTEQMDHSNKPRPTSKLGGRRHDSKTTRLQSRVTKTQSNIITNVPKFDASKTGGRVDPADVPLEAPGIREIQEKFAEKWAADIHRNLARTSRGKALIKSKGRSIKDARKA